MVTISFIGPASSDTRAVALLHQCWSHMSQMTTAVSEDFQGTGVMVICQAPGLSALEILLRG